MGVAVVTSGHLASGEARILLRAVGELEARVRDLEARLEEMRPVADRRPDGAVDVGPEVLGLLTVRQVAGRLSWSERTIRRMIASGKLEAVREGGSVRIAPEAVTACRQRMRPAMRG